MCPPEVTPDPINPDSNSNPTPSTATPSEPGLALQPDPASHADTDPDAAGPAEKSESSAPQMADTNLRPCLNYGFLKNPPTPPNDASLARYIGLPQDVIARNRDEAHRQYSLQPRIRDVLVDLRYQVRCSRL
jgi:hypothetical protein